MSSIKLSPIFSPISITVLGNCLASFPTTSYPCQVSYAIKRSPYTLVSSAGKCCCRDCELVFHFLPTFFIFCCLDPFIFNVAYLIFGLFRSGGFIDFVSPSFLWSSHSSVSFVLRGSVLLLSPPIFRPLAMRFSAPVSISFFCEF